ncbi:MAG: hypothetical protein QXQ50_02170 [Candidatus Bathyarchaeia archaeon]
MKKFKGTEIFTVSTDDFFKEIHEKVSRNPYMHYLVSNAFIFCLKCNEVLLTPQKTQKIVSEKIEQYKREKIWQKHPIHVPTFKVTCKCGWENYIAIFIFRYYIKERKEIIWRYTFWSSQFPDLKSMEKAVEDFCKWANKNL